MKKLHAVETQLAESSQKPSAPPDTSQTFSPLSAPIVCSIKRKKPPTFRQAFISKNVECPSWPKEQKILTLLLNKYPEEKFWSYVGFSFALPSLAWFLTEKGKTYLAEQYKKFLNYEQLHKDFAAKEKEENACLFNENKPKSLKEFLEKWK